MATPDTVEVTTGDEIAGSVIWLHGLGADGHDFEPVAQELARLGVPPLRFVFPHAPVRSVTINGGMAMRAWYDILSLDRSGPEDEAGIRASGEILAGLIRRENERGVATRNIVVAGFSQGGAIALYTALRCPDRLAGLMALSTYLPLSAAFDAEVASPATGQDRDLPVFLAHGSFDPMLPLQLGVHARQTLEGAGFSVEWHEYPMAHAVCAEEIIDIASWLRAVYAAPEEPSN